MCNDGGCAYECAQPWADCDDAGSNGCEKNLKSDPETCGSCGNRCTPGQNAAAGCVDGGCAFGCLAGYYDCNGDVGKGGDCECHGACRTAGCQSNSDCCAGLACKTAGLLPCSAGLLCTCQ